MVAVSLSSMISKNQFFFYLLALKLTFWYQNVCYVLNFVQMFKLNIFETNMNHSHDFCKDKTGSLHSISHLINPH